MNGHSVENQAAGVLDFRIHHRFGDLNGGAYEWFGLDQANVKIGFDYGVLSWLMVGVGRRVLRRSQSPRSLDYAVTPLADKGS